MLSLNIAIIVCLFTVALVSYCAIKVVVIHAKRSLTINGAYAYLIARANRCYDLGLSRNDHSVVKTLELHGKLVKRINKKIAVLRTKRHLLETKGKSTNRLAAKLDDLTTSSMLLNYEYKALVMDIEYIDSEKGFNY